jgi:hypothetical protein
MYLDDLNQKISFSMNLKTDLFFLIISRVNSCLSIAMWTNFDLFFYNIYFFDCPLQSEDFVFYALKRDNLQIKWGKQIKYKIGENQISLTLEKVNTYYI